MFLDALGLPFPMPGPSLAVSASYWMAGRLDQVHSQPSTQRCASHLMLWMLFLARTRTSIVWSGLLCATMTVTNIELTAFGGSFD